MPPVRRKPSNLCVVGASAYRLQEIVNKMNDFVKKRGMKVNVSEVMVFKGGKARLNAIFEYIYRRCFRYMDDFHVVALESGGAVKHYDPFQSLQSDRSVGLGASGSVRVQVCAVPCSVRRARQLSYVRSSRAFALAYCAVCAPSPVSDALPQDPLPIPIALSYFVCYAHINGLSLTTEGDRICRPVAVLGEGQCLSVDCWRTAPVSCTIAPSLQSTRVHSIRVGTSEAKLCTSIDTLRSEVLLRLPKLARCRSCE
ncbi:hypothetical protein EVAR_49197_1 [Eumeta japonica]|uniref:Uncharacterized protein n=1 Tax=Eumeta variegata TaxID=151549 RepID=A0A4C1XQQ3_EUMVA|nr:hypothetical protein EVAR_49197_1 [Eumeta japonica]